MSALCTLQQLEDGHPPAVEGYNSWRMTIGPHLVCAEDSGSGSAGPKDTDPSNNHFLVVYTLLSSTGMDASAEHGPAASETATKAAEVLSINTVAEYMLPLQRGGSIAPRSHRYPLAPSG